MAVYRLDRGISLFFFTGRTLVFLIVNMKCDYLHYISFWGNIEFIPKSKIWMKKYLRIAFYASCGTAPWGRTTLFVR